MNRADHQGQSSPFGVLDFFAWDHDWNGHHYPLEKVRQAAVLMQEAGIGFVRLDFLWADIEPVKGQFDFSRYDALASILSEHHLHILGLLHYNPAWTHGQWNDAPNPTEFTHYAQQVVRHFKGAVKHWEIWNEPDHPMYWQPQDGLRRYSELLKLVSPVLKKEDPGCQILLGGLSNPVPDNLNQIYNLAGRYSFDIVNIHPFVSPVETNALAHLQQIYQDTRAVMKNHGDADKPVWFTELGCPGTQAEPGLAPWWLGINPSESQQAAWVQTIYSEVLGWAGVDKVFWAFFRDTQAHFKDGTDYFGLVRNDFSPKPSYHAYRSAARL